MAKSRSLVPVATPTVGGLVAGLPSPMTKAEKKAMKNSQASTPVMEMGPAQSSQPMSMYAKMLSDPLNGELVGRPDDNTQATNVVRIVDVYDIGTDANGNASWGFYPTSVFKATTNTVSTTAPYAVAIGPGQSSQYDAQLQLDNVYQRALVYVVEWKPTIAVNVMQGKMAITQYNGALPAKNLVAYFNDNGLHGPASNEATSIGRHFTAPLFTNVVSGASQLSSTLVTIAGGPINTTVIGQVVVTQIIEVVPKQSVLAGSSAKHTHCDMMACCVAANIIGPGVRGATGPNSYRTVANKALKIALSASKLFPSPAVSALASLVSSYAY